VENAGEAAFMIKGFNHQKRVMNVKCIDCYSDTGTFQIMMTPDNVLVSGGHFGSMTLGFYLDIADDHHFPDGPWDWTYNFLPVRSIIVENVTVAGDIRINASQDNDAANDYTPEISLNKVTVKSDLYTVGSANLVKMVDCSIKGTHYLKTPRIIWRILSSLPIRKKRRVDGRYFGLRFGCGKLENLAATAWGRLWS